MTTPEAAELTKLLENIFRSVNIALVNELAVLCDRMGIDVWEVVDAAATKPYGFMSFKPGPGMGGHCLPVDPFYLSWRAREFDMQTEFVELAGEVNQAMPYFCVERISRALNDHEKAVRGSRIAIFGVSYKPGVGDLRESPALRIMRILRERGAELSYHDDFVPELADYGLALGVARRARLLGDRDGTPGPGPGAGRARVAARRRLPRRHARNRGGEPRPPVSSGPAPSERAPGLLLGDGAELPETVEIGGNVIVHAGTVVGEGVVLQDGCVIGKPPALGPRSSAAAVEPPAPAVIGAGCDDRRRRDRAGRSGDRRAGGRRRPGARARAHADRRGDGGR